MSEKWTQLLRDYKLFLLIAIGVAALIVTIFFIGQTGQSEELASVAAVAPSSEQLEEGVPPSQSTEILVVDVKGAVTKPGLYQLAVGSRIQDAIVAAGGLTEAADSKSINLAQKVSDEGIVYVATKEEAVSIVPKQAGGDKETRAGLVRLNTATEADLQTISGIGAKRAADIIAYRETNGRFQSVDDLKNVPGIGGKSLENIRPYVTVD
ncbi:helix-hairpin-helix domain-containing protein [Streptococcus acidominimus]|uniref:DNA uptake protein and related DNA-binding proteins n=1 Tax=Streptococcus acidominimus TaxID=1326 RepID=A0A1Q8EEE2_STRAI|nr:helix-hairpin-helix domain-containing protein [Streptococcus acidominimus]OLF50156.1 hypothetical protein BU200_03630 [Streptococcus acidominimus]SUN07438.1 DNA uptake protein and related DNA-binding proteins [Streptococcus acidominimus]